MALWFCNFSTWRGRHGVYLEDLFVHPEHRRRGIGEALLATLAKVCVDRGYTRLEWSVLDWNEPAIDFYRSLGAVGARRVDRVPRRRRGTRRPGVPECRASVAVGGRRRCRT